MAFFTDTATAPKVYTRKYYNYEKAQYLAQDTAGTIAVGQKHRTVTFTEYEFRCLTESAAGTIAAGATDTYTIASAERMNDAGMWRVAVVEQSYGAWT